jgi:DNA-binding GntR family transcriptional regulator
MERRQIVEALESEVSIGKIKPGHRLVEGNLCERFCVKRDTVRQVLRDLEQDGFVKIVPNVGATLTAISQKDIEQTYDLLSVIEGLAVRVITPFVEPEQMEKLESLLIKMESTDIPSQFINLNSEFHTLILSWSDNERLIKFTEILRRNQRRFGTQSFLSPGQIEASRADHKKIFEAMKQRKPLEAERSMRTHLLRAKNRLIKYMNKSL